MALRFCFSFYAFFMGVATIYYGLYYMARLSFIFNQRRNIMKHISSIITVLACLTALSAHAQTTTTVTTTTYNNAPPPITESGFVNEDIVMYSGPGPEYPPVASIPGGETMAIYGCAAGYQWCDVSSAGLRGWVSGDYLYLHPYEQPIITYGPRLTVLPILLFNRDVYWDRYYHDRPFYRTWYQSHPHQRVIYTQPNRPANYYHSRPVVRSGVNINVDLGHNARPAVINHNVVTPHVAVAPHPVVNNHVEVPHQEAAHAAATHVEEHHEAQHDAPHEGGDRGGDHHDGGDRR
jgi:uncharacterized protein YraI